jgi:hypothetical protein
MDEIKPVAGIDTGSARKVAPAQGQPDPMDRGNFRWAKKGLSEEGKT